MNGTKRSVVVVRVTVLVAAGFALWWSQTPETTQPDGANSAALDSTESELADDDLVSADRNTPGEERRAIAGVPIHTSDADERIPLSASGATVIVRVEVADSPWLESTWAGRLDWADDEGREADVVLEDGCFELPRAPSSSAQFTRLDFAGLDVRPVGLTHVDAIDAIDGANDRHGRRCAASFELAAELQPGAQLVWAPSVPAAQRTAVRVVLGHSRPPSHAGRALADLDNGLVDEAVEVELPFVLPRVTTPISLWVGAPGRHWRSFVVAPQDTHIEVRLANAAAIRVLHDGPPGELVTLASHNEMATVVPVEDEQPIVIGDLLDGEHRVWIRRWIDPALPRGSTDNARSRIARVTLVAGETTEVDLRAASVLDGRGGVRIFVRVPNVDGVRRLTSLGYSDHLFGIGRPRPSVWRNATAATPRTTCPPPQLTAESDEGTTFELLGLTPGRHTAFVNSIAAYASFDVVSGEVTEVDIAPDDVGYVQFDLPRAWQRVSELALVPCGVGAAPGIELPLRDIWSARITRGTYAVRALSPGDGTTHVDCYLVSDPFTVLVGATTEVEVRFEIARRVAIAAVESGTGAPIALDIGYWMALDARDVATDAEVVARVLPRGVNGAHTSVVWTLHPNTGPVRFAVPEHALWTFEPLEPRALDDGATLTLRATAK